MEALEAYKKELEAERGGLDGEIKEVEERIKELKKLIEQSGTEYPGYPPVSPWGPPNTIPPTMTQEEEEKFLDERRSLMEGQIKALQKELKRLEDRLEELKK